jgi:hypothetical protein
MSKGLKSSLLVLSTGFMITLNGLANGLPLNGKTTGELSALYPNWFVPAGVTFSIWGVLYLLMLSYVAMRIYKRHTPDDGVESAYMLTALFNGSWIVAWHYEWMGASLLIMGGLLATLIGISHQMGQTVNRAHWLTKLTFGMYLGWILVATVANVTAALVSWGWGGWGIAGPTWAALLVGVAALIGLTVKRIFDNPYILISVIWALIGIMIKQMGGPAEGVVYVAAIFMGILIREIVPNPFMARRSA